MAALIAEGLGCLIHQILFVSSVYPRELFELAPFGSFRYRRSRHPALNKYIGEVSESLQVMLLSASNAVETMSVTILDESELKAEWIIDLMVFDLKNVDAEMYRSWIGSIAVKMQQMANMIPKGDEPSSRTFAVNTGLKQSLSSYRLGDGLDWVLSDSRPDSLGQATIFPCKSFRSLQLAVHNINRPYLLHLYR